MIANGHGGNEDLLPYFAQAQLAAPHDYVVYVHARADSESLRLQNEFYEKTRHPLETK